MNMSNLPREYLSPIQKLRLVLLALALVVFVGTIGFMVLERMAPLDALYMTIITLSTVGFSEVTPLHSYGGNVKNSV